MLPQHPVPPCPQVLDEVVDDRSTDGTGQILDSIAAKDSRLRVVHLKEGSLPPGWGGKSWALHNGLEQANGDWQAGHCLEDPLHYAALRKGARAMAAHFTMERHLPRLIDTLQRVAACGKANREAAPA